MCELLGMSANVPTDICFSFTGLIQRGGRTGEHTDGWGIGFYEGKGYRAFHDCHASAESQLAQFVQRCPIKSHVVICHIRKANVGRVSLENTQPYTRELWGRYWTFAHNGQLKGIKKRALTRFMPVGGSDSEYAFCWMLDELSQQFSKIPSNRAQLHRAVKVLAESIAPLGVFNFLMSDSKNLYAYCTSKLSWITRKAPFGPAELKDADVKVNFEEETTPNDVVTVIATEPLTKNETWNTMRPGDIVVFRDGLVL